LAISAIDAVSPAFQHAKQQLFQPFRVGQWAKLALVGLLAGEMSSGGCNAGNFNFPKNTGGEQRFLEWMPSAAALPDINPALYASLIALLVVLGLVLMVLFLYVSSVMRFVLFDSVLAKHCAIRRGWSLRHKPGLRLFGWQLLLMLATMAGMIILIGIPAGIAFAAGWLDQPHQHLIPLVLGGIALFFLVIGFVLIGLVVQVFTKDFVVPQMALEGIGPLETWRRLLPMLNSEKGGYAGYIGMKVVMALGAAVVLGIVTLIVIVVLLIPFGGLGVVAILAGKAAGLGWNLYTISVAVVAGSILLAVILYVVSLISVPAVVFFPAYSIYFFASRYSPLGVRLNPPPAPEPSSAPPPSFLPPEPAG
jgi:hypothetical protein